MLLVKQPLRLCRTPILLISARVAIIFYHWVHLWKIPTICFKNIVSKDIFVSNTKKRHQLLRKILFSANYDSHNDFLEYHNNNINNKKTPYFVCLLRCFVLADAVDFERGVGGVQKKRWPLASFIPFRSTFVAGGSICPHRIKQFGRDVHPRWAPANP